MEQQAQDDDLTWEGRPWVSAGKLKDKNYLGHNNTPDLFNNCRMVTAKWHCKTITTGIHHVLYVPHLPQNCVINVWEIQAEKHMSVFPFYDPFANCLPISWHVYKGPPFEMTILKLPPVCGKMSMRGKSVLVLTGRVPSSFLRWLLFCASLACLRKMTACSQ